MIFGCPRRKIGIVKQSWRFLICHDCFSQCQPFVWDSQKLCSVSLALYTLYYGKSNVFMSVYGYVIEKLFIVDASTLSES